MRRRRLAFLTDLASDVANDVKQARSRRRRRAQGPVNGRDDAAAEVKRRLDATRERLRSDIPPRED